MKKSGKTSGKKTDEKNKTESDNDFPGYPHYPEADDLMNTGEEEYAVDIENPEHLLVKNENPQDTFPEEDEVELESGNSADVSQKDLDNLGDENLAMDMGDDEDLKHRIYPVDIAGEDLVVPGSELDDAEEAIGDEDEENNLYSHGDN